MKTKKCNCYCKQVWVFFERFITFSTHSTEYKANGDLLLQTEHIQKYFWMPCSLNFINTLTFLSEPTGMTLYLTCCRLAILGWSLAFVLPGDFHEEKVWPDEEGLRVKCSVWLWNCPHHLQWLQQAVSVRQYRHGQSPAEVHRIQRTPREQNQLWHRRGTW